jgi:hypothetical protein
MYAQFVAPGKHSIYIYDPDSDEFYKKIVAIDVPQQKFAYKSLPPNFDLTDDHRHYHLDTTKKRYLEAYLVDTSMCKFNIKDILDKDACPIMETVYKNFETIVSIFQEL